VFEFRRLVVVETRALIERELRDLHDAGNCPIRPGAPHHHRAEPGTGAGNPDSEKTPKGHEATLGEADSKQPAV